MASWEPWIRANDGFVREGVAAKLRMLYLRIRRERTASRHTRTEKTATTTKNEASNKDYLNSEDSLTKITLTFETWPTSPVIPDRANCVL